MFCAYLFRRNVLPKLKRAWLVDQIGEANVIGRIQEQGTEPAGGAHKA